VYVVCSAIFDSCRHAHKSRKEEIYIDKLASRIDREKKKRKFSRLEISFNLVASMKMRKRKKEEREEKIDNIFFYS